MKNLTEIRPDQILLHGPSKLLVNEYHWHEPDVGVVASYTPTAIDVKDHFDIFRGVDQIESFAQATIVSCGTFLECRKNGMDLIALKNAFIPAFISIGQVNFLDYLQKGERFISVGQIKFYKFRQMVADGRIYKVPESLDLNTYFSTFNQEKLTNYTLRDDFKLVAELFDITGRAIKRDKIIT